MKPQFSQLSTSVGTAGDIGIMFDLKPTSPGIGTHGDSRPVPGSDSTVHFIAAHIGQLAGGMLSTSALNASLASVDALGSGEKVNWSFPYLWPSGRR